MPTPTNPANSGTSITPQDLQDLGLYRLNRVLDQLNQRIGTNTTTIKTVVEQVAGIASTSTSTGSSLTSIVGTHAQRLSSYPASGYTAGSLYYETDRTTLYQAQTVGGSNQWVWIGGQMRSALVDIPGDLSTGDTGFLFYENVTYFHVWQWSGSGWAYGPGNDRPSGEFAMFGANPGAGWNLCDGSTQLVSSPTATQTSVALPDMRGYYAKFAAAYTGTGVAAAAPTLNTNTGTVVSAAGINVLVPPITVNTNGTPPTFAVLPYYRL